jgi:hypothetical protein
MAVIAAREIYREINAYIDKQDQSYRNCWYAGSASNPKDRLFKDHNVSESNDRWIYRQCENAQSARIIEEALLKSGCDGESSGGDETTVYVYTYLKSPTTNP